MKELFKLQKIKENFEKFRIYLKKFSSHQKYLDLIKDLQELYASRPNDIRILTKIGETYFQVKDIDNAILSFMQAAEKYAEQQIPLKAIGQYKNILKLDPRLIDIYFKLADLYLLLDQRDEAANQYRIAMQIYGLKNDQEKIIQICQKLVEIDPSPNNRRKLGEIYQSFGMKTEALHEFEQIAVLYRKEKRFDDLLRVYELILPHKPENKNLIRDVCILYLRRQEPDHALRCLERYKLELAPDFQDVVEKAKLMKKTLRAQKTQAQTLLKTATK